MDRTNDVTLSGVLSLGMKEMRRVARREQVLGIVDQIIWRTYHTETSQRPTFSVKSMS